MSDSESKTAKRIRRGSSPKGDSNNSNRSDHPNQLPRDRKPNANLTPPTNECRRIENGKPHLQRMKPERRFQQSQPQWSSETNYRGIENQMLPDTSHEWVPVNQKRQTAFAKDEASKAIPTIATAVVIWTNYRGIENQMQPDTFH
jgi:hypothetical protein